LYRAERVKHESKALLKLRNEALKTIQEKKDAAEASKVKIAE